MNYIDTDSLSTSLRSKAIKVERKEILITNFAKSDQEKDFKLPPNCNGFGRIRHFKLCKNSEWPINPLPILPAQKTLKLPSSNEIQTQVFQNAICNWRCWYCFVDFKLLAGNMMFSRFLSCEDLITLYLSENDQPRVIDLTGGQPDLTPEWVVWMMETLMKYKLNEKIFLWSDDNLSNDYFWRYLSPSQIDLIKSYKNYARVCCFKGIDETSFSKNTKADPKLFANQFDVFKKLIELNIDLYSYITLTANPNSNFERLIPEFFDRIQKINYNYPLRIIPLEVKNYFANESRIKNETSEYIKGQYIAIKYWQNELEKRFDSEMLAKPITDIKIN